jgi:hypothetical protein
MIETAAQQKLASGKILVAAGRRLVTAGPRRW